jgi:hypothetical protein
VVGRESLTNRLYSPHWRGWLKPENRFLIPFKSIAVYAPEPTPETKKKDVVWFAINDDQPLTCFYDRDYGPKRYDREYGPRRYDHDDEYGEDRLHLRCCGKARASLGPWRDRRPAGIRLRQSEAFPNGFDNPSWHAHPLCDMSAILANGARAVPFMRAHPRAPNLRTGQNGKTVRGRSR